MIILIFPRKYGCFLAGRKKGDRLMSGDYNDFNDSFDGGSYSFVEDEIRNASFKVSLSGYRFAAHFIIIAIPVFFYILMYPMIEGLRYLGDPFFSDVFNVLVFATVAMGIIFIVINKGKEIIVSGRGMVIRRYFILQEGINVNEVYKCEVITGLTSHGRYHTEHFNKAVIYFGDGKKVSFNDNMYKNWDKLVGYMELNQKTVYIDGRSRIQKAMDDILGKR